MVVTTTAFGKEGNVTAPFNHGRTTTHEVGHWLDLRHIWGDYIGCGGSGDFVYDTPDQNNPHTGCPSFPQASCGSNDMFMNYMDYTNDACMNLFTIGQRNRMRALFASGGVRQSFIESPLGMSLTGPNHICTSDTYTLTNLPTEATINGWSAEPSTAVSLSTSGNTVALANSGGYNGDIILTATVNTSCGTIEVHKHVYVGVKQVLLSGPYDSASHTIVNVPCVGRPYYFYAQELSPPAETGTTYLWILAPPPDSGLFPMLFSGQQVFVQFDISGTYQVTLNKSNDCGTLSISRELTVADC